jgi:hypothetical protein
MSANAPHYDLVDVAPLREAFLASGISISEVSRRLGWTCRRSDRPGHKADTARLKRALGMQRERVCVRGGYLNRRIGYDLAARIADAIDVDPVDVGL